MRRNDPRRPARKGPRDFDAFELVRQRGTIEGEVDAARLARVAEALAPEGGRIAFAIAGTTDEAERPALDVAIDGELWLVCQRCLQPMRWPASQRITVLLARDESELAQLDQAEEREVVLADAPLDPVALVEDELLLTMPYAPRHPDDEGTACAPAAGGESDTKRASPFDALAAMRSRPVKGARTKR